MNFFPEKKDNIYRVRGATLAVYVFASSRGIVYIMELHTMVLEAFQNLDVTKKRALYKVALFSLLLASWNEEENECWNGGMGMVRAYCSQEGKNFFGGTVVRWYGGTAVRYPTPLEINTKQPIYVHVNNETLRFSGLRL
jgi:hypothetical protein